MKPVLIYVDDEPHNLTVFEAAASEDWSVFVYDNPLRALDEMTKLEPWLVVSDQRMPGMMGVNFLEIVSKMYPHAVRSLVTGFSDEDLVIDAVRKARVFDYIRKPWDVEDLLYRLTRMIDHYTLERDLREQTTKLQKQNAELLRLTTELEASQAREAGLRKELEAWAPPFILSALFDQKMQFPCRKDLAVVTFDLVESSKYHDVFIDGMPARNHLLHAFTEIVLRHGGWRESHAGDSAYAHFGLLKEIDRPADAAFAVASEFRVFIRHFGTRHNLPVECGLGLHLAEDCLVDIHTIRTRFGDSEIVQKSFDSTASDIDLVHRMEKFTHQLPGSNIAMSKRFVDSLSSPPKDLANVGFHLFKGQKDAVEIYLKPSDLVKAEQLASCLPKEDKPKMKAG